MIAESPTEARGRHAYKSEQDMRFDITCDLHLRGIPCINEYRCYDGGRSGCLEFTQYSAVDIAVFGNSINGIHQPLLAVELKNYSDRDSILKGIGQCVLYKEAGFPMVMLVTPMGRHFDLENAIVGAGIKYTYPQHAADAIDRIFEKAGGDRADMVCKGFRYCHVRKRERAINDWSI